jgi:hypothetical protein
MKKETTDESRTLKKNLFCILFDANVVFFTVFLVWRVDVIWHFKRYAYLMTRMYKGTAGSGEGGNFYEEIVPFTTYTLLH